MTAFTADDNFECRCSSSRAWMYVHLDDRPFEDLEGIEHRDGCERIRGRIDDDRVGLFPRRLDEVDKRALMVRLVK